MTMGSCLPGEDSWDMACSRLRMGYQRERETDRFNLVPLMLRFFVVVLAVRVPLGSLGLVESWLQ